MNREFKVYKAGKGEFTLLGSRDISLRHREIVIAETEEVFEPNDALWGLEDKERNIAGNILVIDQVVEPNKFIVYQADGGFIADSRELVPNEKLTLISTFREQ